jgi:hypothetical protein
MRPAWLDAASGEPEPATRSTRRHRFWLDGADPETPPVAPSHPRRGSLDDLVPDRAETAFDPVSPRAALLELEEPEPGRSWATALCVAGGTALFAMLASGLATGDTELLAAVGVAVVLALGSLRLFKQFAKHDGASDLTLILTASLSLKLLGTLARFYVGTSVYDRSDASEYDFYGRNWVEKYLSQGFLPPGVKQWTSTNFVRLVVAEFYHWVTPTMIGGFVFFSWLGFMGLVLFWRGFRRIHPEHERKYLYLVLFAPSLMYWPSSIGKEALVLFGLGIATYGLSLLLTTSPIPGSLVAAAGIVLVTYVRSHVAMVLTLGLAAAVVFRKRPKGKFVGSIVAIVLFSAIASFVVSQANTYFNTSVLEGGAVQQEFSAATDRTQQGGSSFEPTPTLTQPQNFPFALVTVLFRPFPWEATSPQELFTSVEAFAYGVALVMSLKKIWRSFRRDYPFLIFAVVTVILFIVVFSNFANFGILARQRTQVLPFLFIVLCVPPRPQPEPNRPLIDRALDGDTGPTAEPPADEHDADRPTFATARRDPKIGGSSRGSIGDSTPIANGVTSHSTPATRRSTHGTRGHSPRAPQ